MARQHKVADIVLTPIAPQDRGVPLSRAQVADRLGISRARVGQIEHQALDKLRRAAERAGFTLADLVDGSSA